MQTKLCRLRLLLTVIEYSPQNWVGRNADTGLWGAALYRTAQRTVEYKENEEEEASLVWTE